MASPTNWIIASNEMVSVGHRVELMDNRRGEIVRVAGQQGGKPVVRIDGSHVEETKHPMNIRRRIDHT